MKRLLATLATTLLFLASANVHAERYGTPVTRNLANAITVGNTTCIPLFNNDGGNPGKERLVLDIKNAFAIKHPELKIIGSHETYSYGTFVYIWIDHEPRGK